MKLTATLLIRNILLVSGLLCFFSCFHPASRLEQALTLAEDNRQELEKVLARYSADPSDSLKYRAAVFLIENMPGQGYYKGEQLDHFLEYYPVLREVRSRRGSTIEEAVDSIRLKYGIFDFNTLEYYEDIKTIDSSYLCDNIEWAFKVWEEQPWGKNVSFDDFCEYILPYRVGNEAPVRWREMYYNRYNRFLDVFRASENMERDDPAAAAKAITDSLLKGNVTKYGTVSVAMNNTVSKLNEIEKLSSPEGYDGLTEVNIIKDYPCASGIIQFTAHVSVITLGGKIIEASMGDYDFYFPTPNFAGSYGAHSTNSGYIVVYVVGRLEGEIININDNIFYL